MTRPYHAYDLFAEAYNRFWGEPFAAKAIEKLDVWLLGSVESGAPILDLCCGTGQVARELSKRGYSVIGVDGSEAMLVHARANAPEVEFRVGDAREFTLSRRVAAVISLYDSLNHMLEREELGSVFRCVNECLLPGGVFFFDLNMRDKYETAWSGSFISTDTDLFCAVEASYEPGMRLGHFHATTFRQGGERGTWSRSDVDLTQTWYEEQVVKSLLKAAGFSRVASRVWSGDPARPLKVAFIGWKT